MYELIQVSGNDYYIQSPAKIGIVRTGEDPLSYLETLESVKRCAQPGLCRLTPQ